MNRIIHMNHSPKMQERDSEPLPRERDLNVLSEEISKRAGAVETSAFFRTIVGRPYDAMCEECLRVLAYMDAQDADLPAPEYGGQFAIIGGEILEINPAPVSGGVSVLGGRKNGQDNEDNESKSYHPFAG